MRQTCLALVLLAGFVLAPSARADFGPLDDALEATSGSWILPSAARATTTTTSGVISAGPHRCAVLVVQITAGSAFSLTMRVQIQDVQTATWLTIYGGTTMTAQGTYHYVLCPGSASNSALTGSYATASGGITLPPTFRVQITAPDATSATYSVTGMTW